MDKEKILIVDDDENIAELISLYLNKECYETQIATDGASALEAFVEFMPNLILLDVMLPGMDGYQVCTEIRKQSNVPIIMLSAKGEVFDKVLGLKIGADDYITKPFSLSVLRARVNTQLRKQASNHKNAPFHMDLFHFDFEAMTFYVGDSKVELSKTEQKLLRLLVENRGRTMTRGDLVDRIWTDGAEYVDENALSVTIKRLRDKLGAQKYIKTVYGIGYSWVTKDE